MTPADERGGANGQAVNSDTAVRDDPFADPAVQAEFENKKFTHDLIEFLMLHWNITLANARMLMNQAKAYNIKDAQSLRYAKVVQQAENFCHNKDGIPHRGHWAVWHADDLLIRAFEAWPDDSFHERFVKVKQALGNLSTLFNYTGPIEQAKVDLDKFISTGIIPAPPPLSKETIAAAKKAEAARQTAAFEAAHKEQTVTINSKSELDTFFPRPTEDNKVTDTTREHWSAGGSFRIQEGKIKGSQRDSAMMPTEDWNAWVHKIFDVESLTELTMTESAAIEILKDEHSKKFPKNGKAAKPAENKPASTPVAETKPVEPAKQPEPVPDEKPQVEIAKDEPPVLQGEIVSEAPKAIQLVQPTTEIVVFDPKRSLDYVMQAHDLIASMIDKKILVESSKDENGNEIDGDYGRIAGSKKPALYKSGAEKLCEAFGLVPEFPPLPDSISDWKEPFFYFHYKCELYRISDGKRIATANGSCNSKEDKYGWRWVSLDKLPSKYRGMLADLESRGGKISEFDFAVEKAETTGKYGKPESYWKQFTDAIANGTVKAITKKDSKGVARDAWEIDALQYRIPNSDIYSIVNTIDKMAQKRALVGAVLIGTAASRFFTQDLEDMPDFGTMAA